MLQRVEAQNGSERCVRQPDPLQISNDIDARTAPEVETDEPLAGEQRPHIDVVPSVHLQRAEIPYRLRQGEILHAYADEMVNTVPHDGAP